MKHNFRVYSFSVESAEKFLAGDLEALYSAFLWVGTPQGHDFWSRFANGEARVGHRERQMIRRWIARAKLAIQARNKALAEAEASPHV